jgi:Dna[CI] antecedent, DciA
VQPVHTFLPAALASLLRKAPLSNEKVACAWRAAVGPAVDKATTVSFRAGVLRVRARDEVWRREVERSVPLVRARLDALLGAGVVGEIDITSMPTR